MCGLEIEIRARNNGSWGDKPGPDVSIILNNTQIDGKMIDRGHERSISMDI